MSEFKDDNIEKDQDYEYLPKKRVNDSFENIVDLTQLQNISITELESVLNIDDQVVSDIGIELDIQDYQEGEYERADHGDVNSGFHEELMPWQELEEKTTDYDHNRDKDEKHKNTKYPDKDHDSKAEGHNPRIAA